MSKGKRIQDDPAFEIAFYEGVLRRSPGFIEAMSVLAELYTKQGLYDQGLDLDRRLAVLRPDDPVIHYNLACSLSLKGDIAAAFGAMKQAFKNGYEDLDHLEHDQDLVNLLNDPAFQDYYRAVKDTGKPA